MVVGALEVQTNLQTAKFWSSTIQDFKNNYLKIQVDKMKSKINSKKSTISRKPAAFGLIYVCLLVALVFLSHDSINLANGQFEAVGAVLSVVPVTSILATAGLVGVKLAALSRLLQMLGYDRAYLANGGSGTAAQPIGLEGGSYSYMFPYIPGLNISVKGEETDYRNTAGQQQKEVVKDPASRKTYPSMGLPGDYEHQNSPFRGADSLREIFRSSGIEMRFPTVQQQTIGFPPKGNEKIPKSDFESVNYQPKPDVNFPIINNNNQQQQQQQQPPPNSNNAPPPSSTNSYHLQPNPNEPQASKPPSSLSFPPAGPQGGPQTPARPLPHHPQTHSPHSQNSQVSRPHPDPNRNPVTANRIDPSNRAPVLPGSPSRFGLPSTGSATNNHAHSGHLIPQHDYVHRRLQQEQADRSRQLADARYPTPLPFATPPPSPIVRTPTAPPLPARLATPVPLPSGHIIRAPEGAYPNSRPPNSFEEFDHYLFPDTNGGTTVSGSIAPATSNIINNNINNMNSNPTANYDTNSASISPITSFSPPIVDEFEQTGFNAIGTRFKRHLSNDQVRESTVSLANVLANKKQASSVSQDNFGMPALNIHLKRKRRSLADKIIPWRKVQN